MTDGMDTISGGISIAQGVLQFLGYVRNLRGSSVISALFNGEGRRIRGSDKIDLNVHGSRTAGVWWFEVREYEDYSFVRIPLTPSGIQEMIGMREGDQNPDVRYWRWIAQQRQGVIVGGGQEPVNARVEFIVIGYRPEALLDHFSSSVR